MVRAPRTQLTPEQLQRRDAEDAREFSKWLHETTPSGVDARCERKILSARTEEFLQSKDWDNDPADLADKLLRRNAAYTDLWQRDLDF